MVNLHYIKSYSSDTVYLSNGESAFLSKNYQKSFQTSYMNFLKKIMWGYNLMLFYSYAELIIGLVAIFYFTSKYSLLPSTNCILSCHWFYNFNGIVCLLYKKRPTVCNSAGLHFVALTFLPISLGYNKKMMLIFSSLFFSGLTFFIYTIYQLLCSILHIKLTIQSSTVFELISNLIVWEYLYCCQVLWKSRPSLWLSQLPNLQ